MYSFLSNLEKVAEGKKYQVFEAVLGFERAEVIVPLENADAFEKQVLAQKPKSVSRLRRIAESFGGDVK